ncbi:polyprenyl synthetase family protein [Thiomicrospira pelophila]|uniref:polyprenyl synthetase family protein n=1 Tax=Thiomicrospira pelophila TaxID=934 RepID=UPI00068D1ACA|nr:farnesyl diphosphate synthase [Thiomicrospira pelophila]
MNAQLQAYQQHLETVLNQTLDQYLKTTPEPLNQAIRYASLSPGKRIRPALVFAIGEGLGIERQQVEPAACAIELIHSYSLVHDDLPAMDDDDLRRGQPTCHKQFDEATAILVGDAQQTLAFEILTKATQLSAPTIIKSLNILCQASGPNGMIGGQILDIHSENKQLDLAKLTQLHQMKTGALIKAALLLGAAPHTDFEQLQPALSKLGEALGLAFQIQDDIIDIESNTATLGKTQGRDQQLNKSTFPSLMGMQAAKALRDQTIDLAHKHHQNLPFQSLFLHDLINFIAQRQH